MAEEIERIYVIPLKKTGYNSAKAAPTAVKRVKSYLTKHMKVEEKNIWIDDSLNKALWSKGKYNMKSKIRVKAVKFDDGVVEAYLPELEFKKSRREILREEKEKKEPILRKEEMPEGEEGETGGDEDYDIVPGADGEVKIKKKKPAKEKKPKEEDKDTKDTDKTKEKTEKKEEKTEKAAEKEEKETKEKPKDEKKPETKSKTSKPKEDKKTSKKEEK